MLSGFELYSRWVPLSTETALVRVHNDILKAVDDNKSVILLLVDLSAAFDTVDHTILVSRLANRFGIRDTAVIWFRSYLQLRKQFVFVKGIYSSLKGLQYGFPQVSVLGLLPYSHKSIGWYSQKHGISFHLFADDTQPHLSFTFNCPNHASNAKETVEMCVEDIGDWMLCNKLKLNQD